MIKIFYLGLAFVFLFSDTQLFAQDERFIRDLFSGRLKEDVPDQITDAKYNVASPFYKIDITRDNRNESLVYEKRDGQDWFHIHDQSGQRVYSYRFETKGVDSELYRIKRYQLSSSTDLYILYFYEGYTAYHEFHGSGRLYFLTIDHNDLETLNTFRGPSFWDERENFNEGHWRRKYEVGLKDLNDDGVREIIVQHHLVTRVYQYLSLGRWKVY